MKKWRCELQTSKKNENGNQIMTKQTTMKHSFKKNLKDSKANKKNLRVFGCSNTQSKPMRHNGAGGHRGASSAKREEENKHLGQEIGGGEATPRNLFCP